MKRSLINLVFIFLCTAIFPGAALSSDNGTGSVNPSAFLASDSYTFEPVLEGEKVTHDFIVENKGQATLLIQYVKTSCGCTAASYSKEIPPGGSGKISLSLKTTGYGGRSVNKTAHVQTNDPDNMSITLTLSGNIESYAEVEPSKAVLKGAEGEDVRTEIRIIPNKRAHFRITGFKATKGKNISLDLKEVKDQDGIQYILYVINQSKTRAKYTDTIYLTTDSDLKPQITIKVSGEIL